MHITIVGTGYVGLVTGACFAKLGNKVICLDIKKEVVDALTRGEIHIFEPGLAEIVQETTANGLLTFTTNKEEAYRISDIVFICVPTPQTSDGSVDLTFVMAAAQDIGKHIQKEVVVVDKSTVPVGTAEKVAAWVKEELAKRKATIPIHVVSNPEFLAEGSAVRDFMYPTRVCIGSDSAYATEVMKKLYHPLTLSGAPIFCMDTASAELAKYACNAMLATRISFMNEFANFASAVGADIEQVRQVMQTDPRIGGKFLYPGIGYGGSCFPKDVKGAMHSAKVAGVALSILTAVDAVNRHQKNGIINNVKSFFRNNLEHKTLAVWGLAFKKNTDDIRESPAVATVQELATAYSSLTLRCFDPRAMENAKKVLPKNVHFCKTKEEALTGAEALVVLTDWDEFKQLDLQELKRSTLKAIFDGRNLYDPKDIGEQNIFYVGIGRK